MFIFRCSYIFPVSVWKNYCWHCDPFWSCVMEKYSSARDCSKLSITVPGLGHSMSKTVTDKAVFHSLGSPAEFVLRQANTFIAPRRLSHTQDLLVCLKLQFRSISAAGKQIYKTKSLSWHSLSSSSFIYQSTGIKWGLILVKSLTFESVLWCGVR